MKREHGCACDCAAWWPRKRHRKKKRRGKSRSASGVWWGGWAEFLHFQYHSYHTRYSVEYHTHIPKLRIKVPKNNAPAEEEAARKQQQLEKAQPSKHPGTRCLIDEGSVGLLLARMKGLASIYSSTADNPGSNPRAEQALRAARQLAQSSVGCMHCLSGKE